MSDAKATDPETVTGEPLDTRPNGPQIEENDPGEQEKLEQDTGVMTGEDDDRIGDAS